MTTLSVACDIHTHWNLKVKYIQL